MKILLCNIAIRPTPDPFPPVACTTLCNVLIKAGYNPIFYDIDARRPSHEELSEFFAVEQFDIVGISAVVSTGYRYAKNLANIIKRASPKTQIILGGNLAAAYEVILRKCQIDVCVIGEGEKVLLNLVKYWEKHGHFNPVTQELHEIKGIAFLDSNGVCRFTGQEKPVRSDEIEEPDYDLLAKFSNINQYILDPMTRYDFASDPRSYVSRRQGKKMATIFTSKGCINRCTFCHRWIKGYRIIPAEKVISTMKYLIDKYNVGFFCISDECFGEDKKWLEEFIKLVKPLDVLFQIGGARVSIIKDDLTIIRRLKEVGLTGIYFGIESGSEKILKIMEKNATRNENLIAAKICAEAGVYTIIQLVIGMPGENDQTIDETIEFVKSATEFLPYPSLLSINYLQILPGTPCYEFLRYHGFLGNTIEKEEEYLLNVSDINASEFRQYVNVSEEPLSKVKSWQNKILLLSVINWLRCHGWEFPTIQDSKSCKDVDVKYAIESTIKLFFKSNSKIKSFLKSNQIIYKVIDLLGEFFWKIILFRNRYLLYGIKKTLQITLGLIQEEDRILFDVSPEAFQKQFVVRKV